MDIVLGLSMTPTTVHMVLVEGQNADGVAVEEREFAVDVRAGSATDHLMAAMLDAREAAAAAGNQVISIGVTWTDEFDVSGLDEALAAHQVCNVTLAPPFIAATTLAQAVGRAIGYERLAMLFVEPGSATMAVIEVAEGAVADLRDEPLDGVDVGTALSVLAEWAEALGTRPEGVFVVGSGVDVAPLKRHLETVTSLAVSVSEEPETALARGAALASVCGSLSALATEGFAYARVAGAVQVHPDAVTLSRMEVPTEENFAYSVSPDGDTDAPTTVLASSEEDGVSDTLEQRRPVLLLGSVGAVTLITAVVALEVSLALGIRPAAVGLHHVPGQNHIMPGPLLPLAPLAVAPAPRPVAMRPSGPMSQLPPSDASIPRPPAGITGDSPGAPPALLALPVPMPDVLPPRIPAAEYPNYPLLLPLPVVQPPSAVPSMPPNQPPSSPVTQTPTTVPVTQPPTTQPPSTLPVTQPVTSQPVTTAPATTVPAMQPPTTVPVMQPPTTVPVTQPPTTVPVMQPPTTVPVMQPPTYVPVSQPPRPAPAALPPVQAPEIQPPVNLPAPEVPVAPGLETPTVGGPILEVPTIPTAPGVVVPAQDVPPAAPQLPGSLTVPAPNTGGGGAPFGGSGGTLGGGSAGTAGTGPSAVGGGSLGGGSLGGGSLGGGSLGGSSAGGGSSSTGGGSSSIGGSSSSGSSGGSGGGRR